MSTKLLKTSLYFTILSTLASAINFAFYPVISHLLSVASFGDVQLGVSFVMLAASLLTSLSTLALFTTANKKTERNTLASIERLVISLSVVLAIMTAVFAEPLGVALKLQDASLLYILAVIFVVNIPASTWIGTLQGDGRFMISGWISVISALTKLSSAYMFINLGLGAHGALLGIALGSFIMLPLAKIFDRSGSIHYTETFGLFRQSDFSFFIKRIDLLAILGSLVLIALIANIDIMAAKIILSPEAAGAYAQVSTVAKIPYFAGIPIALILFERYIRKSISYIKSFFVYVGLIAIIGLGVIVLSNLLLRVLFNYHGIDTGLLIPLVISFSSYSAIMLCAYQLIAMKRTKRLLILSVVSLPIILIPVTRATSVSDIAHLYMSGILGALLLSITLTYTKYHD